MDLTKQIGKKHAACLNKIGPVRSMDLIKKHESLEKIGEIVDVSSINYVRIRELFNSEQFELKIDCTYIPLQEGLLSVYKSVQSTLFWV